MMKRLGKIQGKIEIEDLPKQDDKNLEQVQKEQLQKNFE